MSRNVFDDRNFSGTQVIDKEDGDEMNIYENADYVNSHEIRKGAEAAKTKRNQTSQHTGCECVKNRSSRMSVCLVLLCVVLLTAVIVLCVLIYTNNHQNHIKNKNLTEERDQLRTNNIDLNRQRDQLTREMNELRKILNEGQWIKYKLSLYYISSEERSWTESRRYCRERGADLIIIDNKEKHDFVKKYSGSNGIWIGLSDSEKEGTWKWVDGSTLTSKFWASNEPNSLDGDEDCVVSRTGWADWPCNVAFRYMCEKHNFK